MFASNHKKHRSVGVLIGLYVLAVCSPLLAKEQPPRTTNVFLMGQNFLKALYPELNGKHYVITINADIAFDIPWDRTPIFFFNVGNGRPGQVFGVFGGVIGSGPARKGEREMLVATQFLSGRFIFNKAGEIETFFGQGPIVESDRNESIHKLIDSHPEWSDEQEIRALKDADARYGPNQKQALMKILPLEKLKIFLGDFEVKSVEFELHGQDKEGSFASLWWRVELEVRERKNQRVSYYATFEPFEGRLIGLGRFSP